MDAYKGRKEAEGEKIYTKYLGSLQEINIYAIVRCLLFWIFGFGFPFLWAFLQNIPPVFELNCAFLGNMFFNYYHFLNYQFNGTKFKFPAHIPTHNWFKGSCHTPICTHHPSPSVLFGGEMWICADKYRSHIWREKVLGQEVQWCDES